MHTFRKHSSALVCALALGFASPLCAQTSGSWADLVIREKTALQNRLQRLHMPVKSRWVRVGEKAEHIEVPVAGATHLVLLTKGGPDGKEMDHAVWGGARLKAADGSVVYLDQLDYAYAKADFDVVNKNKNVYGKPIKIAGQPFEHAMMCHAEGILVYQIDKKYVSFEAEVGIDDASASGSVFFYALTSNPDDVVKPLAAAHPQAFADASTVLGNMGEWLIEPGIRQEADMAATLIARLHRPDHYAAHLKQLTEQAGKAETYDAALAKSCLALLQEVREVLALQDKLDWLNIEAVRLAYADMQHADGFNVAAVEPQMKRLEQLVAAGFDAIYEGDAAARRNAGEAIACKRAVLLANPLLDADRIVAARYKLGSRARTAMAPALGTQANNWSNQESAARSGFDADIVELSGLRSDALKLHTVYRPDNGSSVADLRLHWDADRVLFSQTRPDRRWNVFEVGMDGKGFRSMIENDEPDLEFYDGTYLPDGRVVAVSNIGYNGVPCVNGSDAVGNMILYDPQKKSLRRLTFDQDANWNPVIMNNGRIMYTRWEYTDLTHYYSRIVMHMNPDGTECKALYGSGSMFPNSTFDMQPLPGHGSAFVGIISGHHGIARSGRMMIFDPIKARKGTEGIVQELPHRGRAVEELIKDELVNGVWPQFIKPAVLSDKYFLVAAKLSPTGLWGIYLIDVFDNLTCIAEAEGEGFISPILVKKRATPPAIPDRIKPDEKEATFFIQDIYEGEGMRGIPRGTVKELRVHAYEYAYVKTLSDHNWHGIQSGWDMKRQLGTVPVEEDGSVIFKAPANTPISIQPLDAEGVAVQWMRSWVTGQPGEVVSCVGCHEDQNQIPIPKRVQASQKSPAPLTPPEGGIRSFTFDLEIQPILDRHCVSCHDGKNGGIDFRGGEKDSRGYGTSYLQLHPYVHRQGGEGDMVVLQPYEYHPNTSELVRMLKKGHYGVSLSDKEWRKLYNWIDYNAPDKGYFNANAITDFPYQGYDQVERRRELTDKYANGAGVDWKKEIADYAAYLKAQGPVEPAHREFVKPKPAKDIKMKHWPFSAEQARALQQEEGETRREVELAPGVKVTFVRIPAGEFVMGSSTGEPDARPACKAKVSRAFWMAELETTNAQYHTVFPAHDSRYVDQQWKDHVNQGYPANLPDQPVIRVSYNDAMAFCDSVSRRTGLKVTLPTESQWEWACRAGSDSDFWYGDTHSDFGKKENLADKTTLKFAVEGIDPQPMSPGSPWYKYYIFLPKEESVDDGNLVQVGGPVYESNPFGLYNMQGNVAEWTRSDYKPYPYDEKPSKTPACKVARGGSYIDRPKYATAHTRKAYYPYQRVFNVGFRMIIED